MMCMHSMNKHIVARWGPVGVRHCRWGVYPVSFPLFVCWLNSVFWIASNHHSCWLNSYFVRRCQLIYIYIYLSALWTISTVVIVIHGSWWWWWWWWWLLAIVILITTARFVGDFLMIVFFVCIYHWSIQIYGFCWFQYAMQYIFPRHTSSNWKIHTDFIVLGNIQFCYIAFMKIWAKYDQFQDRHMHGLYYSETHRDIERHFHAVRRMRALSLLLHHVYSFLG